MRTTLTLDDDVAATLKAEARRSGRSFKAAVNDLLRLALNVRQQKSPAPTFSIRARDLGETRPGLSLDNVGDVVEATEGPEHR